MTEYRGWVYVFNPQGSSDRGKDWTAWEKNFSCRAILHAATELDIRRAIEEEEEEKSK